MHSPRRLTFTVGTSLLTASLVTAGCAKNATVNPKPEPPHVNEGPAPDEPAPDEPAPDEPAPDEPAPDEGPIVNTAPTQ
jgi:hypothetical protein